MVNVLTVPSSVSRQAHITNLMNKQGISDWVFWMGKETNKRYDGLFDTIKNVIRANYDAPYVILFEDDVCLTDHFTFEVLQDRIGKAQNLEADILLGGIKEFDFKLSKGEPLTKVHNYRGSQLMVIFKRVYDEILAQPSGYGEFELFSSYHPKWRKFVTLPFLAYQENFPSRFLPKSEHKQDYIDCEKLILNQ